MGWLRRALNALRAPGPAGEERQPAQPGTWRDDARGRGLIPIVASWEAYYLLSPRHEPLVSAQSDFLDAAPVIEPTERNWVLYGASRRFPELAHLRPVRAPGDATCPTCGGTGRRPRPAGVRGEFNIVCDCGGLGWLPAGAPELHRDQGV